MTAILSWFRKMCTHSWILCTLTIMCFSSRIMYHVIRFKLPRIGFINWRLILEIFGEWCSHYSYSSIYWVFMIFSVEIHLHTESFTYIYQVAIDSYQDSMDQHLFIGLLFNCGIDTILNYCILLSKASIPWLLAS